MQLKAMKLCAAWEKSQADICTRRKNSPDWSVEGFLFEEQHKYTLTINEELSGAQRTQFKREPLRSPSDMTTISKSGAEVKHQMKACSDAAATGKAAKKSPKYDGILVAKVVTSDQCTQINRSRCSRPDFLRNQAWQVFPAIP